MKSKTLIISIVALLAACYSNKVSKEQTVVNDFMAKYHAAILEHNSISKQLDSAGCSASLIQLMNKVFDKEYFINVSPLNNRNTHSILLTPKDPIVTQEFSGDGSMLGEIDDTCGIIWLRPSH
jgi:hypothetical protein